MMFVVGLVSPKVISLTYLSLKIDFMKFGNEAEKPGEAEIREEAENYHSRAMFDSVELLLGATVIFLVFHHFV